MLVETISKCLLIVVAFETRAVAQDSFPVEIAVDASRDLGELREIWRFFGCDEPNYAYMTHGEELIGELGSLRPQNVFFRAHNLLTTGDGTPALKWGSTNAYTEADDGSPIYDWTILDRIFDTYLEHGVRPYAQIGFMPEALSSRPVPYQHSWRVGAPYEEIYTGWAYPPTDYDKWGELAYQWASHCVERYGEDEVAAWYWQTWNEPNIPYWQGTPEEFHRLHDYAIAGVRRALPNARVGGPDVAGDGGQFMRDFLDHCLHGENYATGESGTPLDFVSFHAKGSPRTIDGHVQMGMDVQLRTIDEGFRIISEYPELEGVPVIIGESDPEGCAACQGPQLAYRNGTMYSSYTAASFARKLELADRHGVNFEGALTWAFEFEGHPYFAGFRSLATNGINKPVLNVFRMYSLMSGRQIAAESDAAVPLDEILDDGVRDRADVGTLSSRDDDTVCVMVWHYHDDDLPGPSADVSVSISGLDGFTGPATLTHYRVDEHLSNAFTLWKEMGSPQSPDAEQYAALDERGQLQTLGEPQPLEVTDGEALIEFDLPRAGVSLLVIQFAGDAS